MGFPAAEEFIVRAEQQLGVRLPDDHRAYLLRSNGGEVEIGDEDWRVFPVFDDSDRKRAGRSANHVVRETMLARSWAGFPSGAVAIAEDGAGNRLVFLASRENSAVLDSAVYRWDHETGEREPIAERFAELG
jgi:hypothetical protein